MSLGLRTAEKKSADILERHFWRWELVAEHVQEMIPTFDTQQVQPTIPPRYLIFTLGSFKTRSRLPTRSVLVLISVLQGLASTWDRKDAALSPSAFETGCKSLYDQTTSIIPSEKDKLNWKVEDYEFEAFRLACLLYSSQGVEDTHTQSQLRQSRVSELRRCLSETQLSDYWTDIPGALIWCLAVGAKESWGLAEYYWFMPRLFPMLMALAIERWDELEISLSIFGWLFRCSRVGIVLPRV